MTPIARQTKYIAVISVVTVVIYFLVTMAFVLPSGPLKSALGPASRAAAPYFTQKWNVFAPNIAKSNPQLRFRAQWIDEDGERIKSGWVNLTDIEFGSIPGRLLPSRVHKTNWNMLIRYQTRYRKLTSEQQKIARDTFIRRIDGGFAAKTTKSLQNELGEHGKNPGAIRDFLRYDDMMKEYVSYFATAYFDREIIRVRWQSYREYPNSFEHRETPETLRKPAITSFGWRHVDGLIDDVKLAEFTSLIQRYGSSE